MKSTEQLLNNIVGQTNGVKKMIEEGKDCNLVLNQMKAVKSAVSSVMDKFIEENMNTCLSAPGKKENKEMMQKLFKELAKK